MPCLPVDSAISCSTQSPKLSIAPGTTNVALSRPCSASSPSATPSQSPEFDDASPTCAQFCSATWLDSSIALTSTPASAAGTSPKYDSTE